MPTEPPTGTLPSTLQILFPSIELLRAHRKGIDPEGPPPFPLARDDEVSLAVEILAGPQVIEVGLAAEGSEVEGTQNILPIGRISESQLSFLRRELEATSSTRRTFYIQTATVNWLDELGLDTQLRAMLRRALGEEPGVDIYWRDPLEEKEDEEDRAYF